MFDVCMVELENARRIGNVVPNPSAHRLSTMSRMVKNTHNRKTHNGVLLQVQIALVGWRSSTRKSSPKIIMPRLLYVHETGKNL